MTGDYGLRLDRFKAATSIVTAASLLLFWPPPFLVPLVSNVAVTGHLASLGWVLTNPGSARAHATAAAVGLLVWLPAALSYAIDSQPAVAVTLCHIAALTSAYDVAAIRRIAFFERQAEVRAAAGGT